MHDRTSTGLYFVGPVVADISVGAVGDSLPRGATLLLERAGLAVGGNAAVAAIAAARCGARSTVAGAIGDDALGHLLHRQLSAERVGLDALHLHPSESTSLTVALCRADGERTLLHQPGANRRVSFDEVMEQIERRDPGVLVFGGIELMAGLREGAATLAERARRIGWTIAVDTTFSPEGVDGDRLLDELLPHVELLFTSLGEATALTGKSTAPEVARALSHRGARTVIVKAGAVGCIVWPVSDPPFRLAAPSVEAVDATGAGDNFVGAFLARWSSGAPLDRAAQWGVACGSCSVRHVGGAAQYDASEAKALADALTCEPLT